MRAILACPCHVDFAQVPLIVGGVDVVLKPSEPENQNGFGSDVKKLES